MISLGLANQARFTSGFLLLSLTGMQVLERQGCGYCYRYTFLSFNSLWCVRQFDPSDFLPRQPSSATARPLLTWLIRRVEVSPFLPACTHSHARQGHPWRLPAPRQVRAHIRLHTTHIVPDTSIPPPADGSRNGSHLKVIFSSPDAKLNLNLRYIAESALENVPYRT